MKVVVEDPARCQLVDVRRLDAPPEASVATEVTEARVVQDNDHDVGRANPSAGRRWWNSRLLRSGTLRYGTFLT